MTPSSAGDLGRLFDPRSIAIVGASANPAKWGHWLARSALRGQERRAVYLVNKNGGEILGQPVHRSPRDLPEPPEMVVITVPVPAFEAAVDEALAAGARLLIGITAGFGEMDAAGRERERRIVQRVRAAGARFIGPNCMAVFDAAAELRLLGATFSAGPIGVVSQSGNMCLELGLDASRRGLGVSRAVSLGNQIDVEAGELIDELARDDRTRALVLYIEEFRDGRRFVESVRRATEVGKPVVLLTVGGSPEGARAARSHTGSLAGSLAVVDAACRVAGALRVASPQRAIDVAQLLLGPARPRGRRLGIITDGGGHAALAADLASVHGLGVPSFSPDVAARVAAALPPTASTTNPVDLAGGGEQDVESYQRVTRVALTCGEVDAVLLTGFFGGYSRRSDEYRRMEVGVATRLAEACRESGRPLVVQTMHFDTPPADELRSQGIPVYPSVEAAIAALAQAARWSEPRPSLPALPSTAPPVARDDYWSARELMTAAGLPMVPARRVTSPAEAERAASAIGFPVVVKALGLDHKSDAGGVVLDVRDPDRLARVVEEMLERLAPPTLTIEAMAPLAGSVELIAGARWDRGFGPVVLVGLGGIYTETLHDTAIALAPVDEEGALDLLRSLRGAPLLAGARGRPAMALGAAARVVSRLSVLAARHPEIAEMEVNPLLVTPETAVGLDARVVLASPPATDPAGVQSCGTGDSR
jgi:acetate---CoA ligase (ADP-forming)